MMRLYAGTSLEFVEDAVHNRIAEKLKCAFMAHYRCEPGGAEVASWRNSLRAMSQIIERAHLKDHGVMLEYQLPATSKRLDFMVTGRDQSRSAQAVMRVPRRNTASKRLAPNPSRGYMSCASCMLRFSGSLPIRTLGWT